MNSNISIIIPTYNCLDSLKLLMNSIELQSLQPSEVIIVDSSSNSLIQEYTNLLKKRFPIIYFKSSKNYPGAKRNEGVKLSSYDWLAFLDVGTIPRVNWLKKNYLQAKENGLDVVFGSTKYLALNHFQKLLRAATYGCLGHETTPGTLVKKDIFNKSGGFIGDIRAGDDQEWRFQLRDICKDCGNPDEISLDYSSLPNSLVPMQKKYFVYYLHGAKVRAQRKVRDIYLSIVLVFSSLIITQWNHLIGGWSANPLFIPNITKIYLLSLVIFLLLYLIIKSIISKPDQFNLFNWFAKVFLFFIVLFTVYFWNFYVADWDVDSILFIPHITKIYITLVLATSFFYRGIFLPLKLGIKTDFIFPKNWIIIGLIGLSLDLVKAPGICLGIILSPFQKNLSKT
jgi:glycosyltransferase involved in cell wall biosynthesis